ncbi:MAG: hypothetical protein JWP81_2709 [Ferruginibacter sp.]|nr:hypothetical protein [Ferruginibacter sp.]
MENNKNQDAPQEGEKHTIPSSVVADTTVIPVVKEYANVDTEVIETAKVIVKKRVVQEQEVINIPLKKEAYATKRVAVDKQVFDEPPATRYESGNIIIPVVREVAVVTIRYEVEEELHIIQTKTEVPLVQEVTLSREEVTVERIPLKQK